jgi:hypothetical protein
LLLYIVFLSLPKVEKKLKLAPSRVIKIALISPVKKVEKKKVEKKKPTEPIIIEKPKPKKIIKKK